MIQYLILNKSFLKTIIIKVYGVIFSKYIIRVTNNIMNNCHEIKPFSNILNQIFIFITIIPFPYLLYENRCTGNTQTCEPIVHSRDYIDLYYINITIITKKKKYRKQLFAKIRVSLKMYLKISFKNSIAIFTSVTQTFQIYIMDLLLSQ